MTRSGLLIRALPLCFLCSAGSVAAAAFDPPECLSSPFTDVGTGHPYCEWIQQLEVDGITGGFNFQAAWTTGWIAGRAMAGVAD